MLVLYAARVHSNIIIIIIYTVMLDNVNTAWREILCGTIVGS